MVDVKSVTNLSLGGQVCQEEEELICWQQFLGLRKKETALFKIIVVMPVCVQGTSYSWPG